MHRFAIGLALATSLVAVVPGAAHAQPTGMAGAFTTAAGTYQVPREMLVAIGYAETHLSDHHGQPSQDNGYGVMHLAANPDNHTLDEAAALTGLSQASLRGDIAANIRGAAAVLSSYARKEGIDRKDLSSWYPVVARYAGTHTDATARIFADDVYKMLRVQPKRGRLESVQSGQLAAAAVPQYPPAHWVAANGNNYQPGRSSAITTIVIHVTQGSYAGTVSWFQNPSAQVSAHYVVRSSDGDITQMVREEDTAYHVRDANSYALGIEHEGFIDDPSWFTDPMYRASAGLTRYLADKWGIPRDRAHIMGHNEVPGNDHTDPGPNWNWNYYMSLVNGGGGKAFGGAPADFNGDGKDDIVTFTMGSLNDVYVATSTGSSFAGTSVKWNDYFGLSGETTLTGDFNGDNRDDVVTFTGGSLGDVYVGLSTGTSFGGGQKWQDWFAPGSEVPAVGDVNGDGKDDIVTFTHDGLGDVYVALSTGTSFGPGQKWHDWFALAGEFPAVGDVNGDGKADIITFTQGPDTAADVYVALSTGTSFGPSTKWHDLFAVGAEQPRVGDFNGDGKTDIATFTCDGNADVYVALSDGSSFVGNTVKWQDYFCVAGDFPYVGDYNGDGKDDIITFTKGSTNDVWVGLSTGTAFNGGVKWHDYFGLNGETTL